MKRRAFWLALAAIPVVPAAMGACAFWREYASFRSPPTPVDHATALRELPELLEVSLPSPAGTLRGWFVPGRERAAVVLLHGCGGNRGDVLPELTIVARAGLSGLAFDWPGEGESGGEMQWGANERAALRSAVDWLERRPEVDPARIGAFGFSLGSWILLQEASTDPRIRAVAVSGAPASMVDFSYWSAGRLGRLGGWASIQAMRARGMMVGDDEPADVVRHLSPRPLLVIAGEADKTVPAAMSRDLFDAAAAPKELLMIPSADHGEYAKREPTRYSEHLASFFATALIADGSGAR